MLVCSKQQINTSHKQYKIWKCFIYLKSKVISVGKNTMDIKYKIEQAKQAFFKNKKLQNINKINISKTLIKH